MLEIFTNNAFGISSLTLALNQMPFVPGLIGELNLFREARRYRRPVQPVGEALPAFLLELLPHWEPMERITETIVPTIEVAADVRDRAGRAIQDQIAAGGRARKTNPKRKALTELSEQHATSIADLVLAVHDGRAQPDALEDELRRLAGTR